MTSPRYGASVYWQETSHGTQRARLTGHRSVDVAIVGAGFTGLWTAYHLLLAEPTLTVAVVEGDQVGFGASGRNAGFVVPALDNSWAQACHRLGSGRAKAAYDALASSVTEMGRTVVEHGIDCDWTLDGVMVVAADDAQLHRLRQDLDAIDRMGLTNFRPLSTQEAQAHCNSPTYRGGWLEEHAGLVHPAKLINGLAATIEGLGATIHEDSMVTGIDESPHGGLVLRTADATLHAHQVALTTSAWATTTPWFKSRLVPVFSYVAVTEPLSDSQWNQLHWSSNLGIEDKRNFFHAYRRTSDGRILWNGADGVTHLPTKRIQPSQDRNSKVLARLTASFRTTFPQLADVRFTHHWGGPVGVTADLQPLFGTILNGRLHYGLAYSGHGVVASHLGGKILCDKLLARPQAFQDLHFVDAPMIPLPPDPLRWIGAQLTRLALRRQDTLAATGKQAHYTTPWMQRAIRRLSSAGD